MRFIGLQPQQPAGKREVSGGLFLSLKLTFRVILLAPDQIKTIFNSPFKNLFY